MNATQCKSWEHFVNLHRIVHNSNEELDAPYIRNMSEEDLQRAIVSMSVLVNCPKYNYNGV